jgi:bifunctional non-homologous end joining protein LigD
MKKSAQKLTLTNVEKVFWPNEAYTKGDVIAYYDAMSDVLLPYLKDRPENLNRHPGGIAGPNFYQKNFTYKPPAFVKIKKIWSDSNDANLNYLLCQNKETLLYLANLGCIEINPWSSRIGSLDKPDWMILDLDPDTNTFEEVIKVAQAVHKYLELSGTKSYVKTSGKTGIHILVPTGAKYEYATIRDFAHLLMQMVHRDLPTITSLERNPRKRPDKIYLDYLQNSAGQTIAAPYSLRPAEGATVSTPLEWNEIKKGLDPKKFTIKTIFPRLKKKGDLFKPVLGKGVDLKKAVQCLEQELQQ